MTALASLEHIRKHAVKWILNEDPYVSYTDNDFLSKQKGLDLLPIRQKFLYSDLVLFYNIVYKLVNIKLPTYVIRMEPQNVARVTRSTQSIAEGTDRTKMKCNIRPKVNSFRDSYFYRTVEHWNMLPLELRNVESLAAFKVGLKEHLWLILGLDPD